MLQTNTNTNTNEILLVNLKEKLATKLLLNGTKDFKSTTTKSTSSHHHHHHSPLRHIKVDVYLLAIQNDKSNILNWTNNNNKLIQRWLFSMRTTKLNNTDRDDAFRKKYLFIYLI